MDSNDQYGGGQQPELVNSAEEQSNVTNHHYPIMADYNQKHYYYYYSDPNLNEPNPNEPQYDQCCNDVEDGDEVMMSIKQDNNYGQKFVGIEGKRSMAANRVSSTKLIAPSDYEHIYRNQPLFGRKRYRNTGQINTCHNNTTRANSTSGQPEDLTLADFVLKAVYDFINRQESKYIR